MKRLTEYESIGGHAHAVPTTSNMDAIMRRLAAYEDTGLTPEQIKELLHDTTGPLHHKLGEWIDAEAAGRLVVLPCKVGDGLWTFCSHPVERVYSFTVTDISTLNGRTMLNTSRCGVIDARDVGKTVFLTREEAEAALKGGDLPENRTDRH